MGIRFNPSSNEYTKGLTDVLNKYAFSLFENELKKKNEAEQITNWVNAIKRLQGGGVNVEDITKPQDYSDLTNLGGLFGENAYPLSIKDKFKIPTVDTGETTTTPLSTIQNATFPITANPKAAMKKFFIQSLMGTQNKSDLTSIPEGYQVGYDKVGKAILEKTPKPSLTTRTPPDIDLTNKVMGNIKTEDDLKELLKNKTAYKEAGVNVGAVLKNYLTHPIVQKNPTLLQKIKNFLIE